MSLTINVVRKTLSVRLQCCQRRRLQRMVHLASIFYMVARCLESCARLCDAEAGVRSFCKDVVQLMSADDDILGVIEVAGSAHLHLVCQVLHEVALLEAPFLKGGVRLLSLWRRQIPARLHGRNKQNPSSQFSGGADKPPTVEPSMFLKKVCQVCLANGCMWRSRCHAQTLTWHSSRWRASCS